MSQPNLVLVQIGGADPVDVTNIVGTTDVVVLDWNMVDTSSSVSTEEALIAIARLKIQLFPWQEQITRVWADLIQFENDWLEMAASDANLTYTYGRDK